MSSSNCCFGLAYRFLRSLIRWYGIFISLKIFQFIVIHTVKGFGVVNKAEIDVFLEFSFFFDDPANVGNLTSGSSVFSNELTPTILWPRKVLELWYRPFFSYCSYEMNCGKFWNRWEYQISWSASWEICMQVRKQQLELDRLVPNRKRSSSRLYIVTLFI